MDGFETLGTDLVYEGRIASVRVDQVRMPDGAVHAREVVVTSDAVAAVAIDDEGRVVLVRQYRHPVRGHLDELPAGKLDVHAEPPRDAMRRELAEEVGLAAAELEELASFHNSAGWTTETTTIYLARGLSPARPADGFAAEGEEAHMQVRRVPLDEALAGVRRGEIRDAKTVLGLLLAAERVRSADRA